MSKFPHQIMVGNTAHVLEVSGKKMDGKLIFDADSLIAAQKDLAIKLLFIADEFDLDLFNYVINVSGLRGFEVADLLSTTASHISQLRRGKKESCSPSLWKLFRMVFVLIFDGRDNRVIDKIAKGNKDAA